MLVLLKVFISAPLMLGYLSIHEETLLTACLEDDCLQSKEN